MTSRPALMLATSGEFFRAAEWSALRSSRLQPSADLGRREGSRVPHTTRAMGNQLPGDTLLLLRGQPNPGETEPRLSGRTWPTSGRPERNEHAIGLVRGPAPRDCRALETATARTRCAQSPSRRGAPLFPTDNARMSSSDPLGAA